MICEAKKRIPQGLHLCLSLLLWKFRNHFRSSTGPVHDLLSAFSTFWLPPAFQMCDLEDPFFMQPSYIEQIVAVNIYQLMKLNEHGNTCTEICSI